MTGMRGRDTSGGGEQRGLRAWLDRVRARLGFRGRAPSHQSVAFTSAFVALAAKMAKADGVAVAVEWEAFERYLELPPSERANVRRVFDQAKADVAGAEAQALRINDLLGPDDGTKRDVLECLLNVACSDGILHPQEDELLSHISSIFGFSQESFRAMRALFVSDPNSPYEVLGVSPDASDSEIKAAYRALAAQAHPDLLIAAGAPAPLVKAATAKLAHINAAYDEIVQERRSRAGR